MLKFTKEKMNEHALKLAPSSEKAQCFNIARLVVGSHKTIANALEADHRSRDGALRAASLMVAAGCASESPGKNHCYGTFIFEDDSTLN